MDITSELTITIPLRIDSKERTENLNAVVDFFINRSLASIILLEADINQLYFPTKHVRLSYHFIKDLNPLFHRTRYINQLLALAPTNIVGVWDTDVIVPLKQIHKGVKEVKEGIVLNFPYDGRFIFLNESQSVKLRKDVSNLKDLPIQYIGRSIGGAFIVNRDKYGQAGGENENFDGWGPEDMERVKRMEILELPISRISGELYHLYHPRGRNSTCDDPERDKRYLKILLNICRMNKQELTNYIAQNNTSKYNI